MKAIKLPLLLCAALASTLASVAAVDLATLAKDSAENVFSGQNYSWTSLSTRPDGTTVTVSGKRAGTNASLSIQEGTTTRTIVVVNNTPYVSTDTGWETLGRPPGPFGPPPPSGGTTSSSLPPPPPPGADGRGRGPGGPGAHGPDKMLLDAISRVTSWSATGDVLTGSFSGAIPQRSGRGDSKGQAAPTGTESLVLKLWIQNGALSKAEVASTAAFTTSTGGTVTRSFQDATTFTAVGTTTVTIPADLTTYIANTSK